jgi:hypothetical protein
MTPEQFISAVQEYLAKHGRNMSCKEVDRLFSRLPSATTFNDDVVALVACMIASVDLSMAAAPEDVPGILREASDLYWETSAGDGADDGTAWQVIAQELKKAADRIDERLRYL